MLNIKLIIAATGVLLVIGIAAYIGIQSKRIDLLKSENAALRVSLESAEGVLKNQSEQITGMNAQLAANDEVCRKQLEARKTVKAIFKPPKKQSEAAHSILRASAEPAKKNKAEQDCAAFIGFCQDSQNPQFTSCESSDRTIDDEKNTIAVTYLNELFGVRTADGL